MSSLLALLAACAHVGVVAQSAKTEPAEEIVVRGRVPGPPLWKVSKGEHVMWILPSVGMVPKGMEWETARVERLIAEAQEFISIPYNLYNVTVPRFADRRARASQIFRETIRLPKGETLADVAPAALYERFAALKARYFPRDDSLEELTPYYASMGMTEKILDEENFVPFGPIMDDIDLFLRRNKSLRRTNLLARETMKSGEFQQLMMADARDFPPWRQLPCLERRITFFERDLPAAKRQANGWALGRLADLNAAVAPRAEPDPCFRLPNDLKDEAAAAEKKMRESWLAAAEAALTSNISTFAALGIDDLIAPGGLLAALQAKGYTVEISAANASQDDDAPR